MQKIEIPAFGETEWAVCRENAQNDVYTLIDRETDAFEAYAALLQKKGFELREERSRNGYRYAAFFDGEDACFLNYFGGVRELMIVFERQTAYFSYKDQMGEVICTPQITQVKLEDYGMSYAIRLSDGRFIVIDGGWPHEGDCDRLFDTLAAGSMGKPPVIAAWILSHPHPDHYLCFPLFMERHGEAVTLERVMYHFPESDDLERYPAFANTFVTPKRGDCSAILNIPRMEEMLKSRGVPIYTPHTGQKYTVGDATLEVLASMDDTLHRSKNINALSLVLRMELAGQVILWTTDASFSFGRIPDKVGSYLKSDILQIPHHGFQCGTAEEELRGYRLIEPRVCFLPASDLIAYSAFCTHRKGTSYLMRDARVEELLTGRATQTITLPYTPRPEAKQTKDERFRMGRDTCGANAWVFCGLSTDRPEDFVFSILNSQYVATPVIAELYFETKPQLLRYFKLEMTGACFRAVDLLGEDFDGSYPTVNPVCDRIKSLPPNQRFAVRFLSDSPIVVWHPDHKAAFHSGASLE